MELKSNIYKIIEDSGLQKGFVAKKMRISINQLWKWDKCKSYPTTPKLFELAKILGVSPGDLYEEINSNQD